MEDNALKNFYDFSKCCISNNTKEFLEKFKKIILNKLNNINNYKDKEYLYEGSSSCLFFPKKNIIKQNQKNILIFTHEFSRTGAPVVVLDMAKVLVKNGYFVTVISPSTGPLIDEFIKEGIPTIVSEELNYLQFRTEGIENFKEHIDLDLFVNSFDSILMNTATLYNSVRRYMNTNKKIIWWLHEGSDTYKYIGDRIPKYVTKNIDVYCVGQYAIGQMKKYGFKYDPTPLNYGVFDVKRKNNIDVKKSKVTFLSVGTIGTRKGQLDLIEAIKLLPVHYLKMAEFIFVGDVAPGDIEGEKVKQKLIEVAKNTDNVKVYSSLKREKLFELYNNIDVLVVSSIDDPMPVVATENFILKNVCICSDHTGTASYIHDKENGFVFESGNTEQLAEKITYILKNKNKLNDIKENGRKIYEQYFDMKIFEKNILAIIEKNLNV